MRKGRRNVGGCNCGRGAVTQDSAPQTRGTYAGAYPLYRYQDCMVLHTGEWAGLSIYVVGRMTSKERLFTRRQLAEASAYANSVRADIENIPTAALCDQAVVDFFTAA